MTDEQAQTASRRRKAPTPRTDAKTRARIDRVVIALEGLLTLEQERAPIIAAMIVHMGEEEKARPEREKKERFEQQQISVMAATVAELAEERKQEQEKERARGYRLRVLLNSGAVVCVSAMGLVDTGYIATSSGTFGLVPLLEIVAANIGLFFMAALLRWVSTPVPPLTAQQVSPVTTVQP